MAAASTPREGERPSSDRSAAALAAAALQFVAPQLATLVDQAPAGDDWLHEVKFDGFRILCRLRDGAATLFTRSGQDWTDRFASVARAAIRLAARSALMDGEAAVLRPDGTTSFQALQNTLGDPGSGSLRYFVFDLLFLEGRDLRPLPLEERKALLHGLLGPAKDDDVIRYADHVIGQGTRFFEAARAAGLEGIVSKLRQAPYQSGRSQTWLKTKVLRRQEFVIGGFTEPEGARTGLGALLVGFFRDGRLVYAGKVGTGFTQKFALALRARLDALVIGTPPFAEDIRGAGRQLRWVRPEVVAEIAYSEMTSDGKLRHPSFQGLRDDKRATEVVGELPRATSPNPSRKPRPAASSSHRRS